MCEVLIKKYNKPGYDYVELRDGTDGKGRKVFVVQTQR